jgi:hypothetical protein
LFSFRFSGPTPTQVLYGSLVSMWLFYSSLIGSHTSPLWVACFGVDHLFFSYRVSHKSSMGRLFRCGSSVLLLSGLTQVLYWVARRIPQADTSGGTQGAAVQAVQGGGRCAPLHAPACTGHETWDVGLVRFCHRHLLSAACASLPPSRLRRHAVTSCELAAPPVWCALCYIHMHQTSQRATRRRRRDKIDYGAGTSTTGTATRRG